MDITNLTSLHDAVAALLLDKLKSGDATASDVANAIKFLKDNGVNCDATHSKPLQDLTQTLPTIEDLEELYR